MIIVATRISNYTASLQLCSPETHNIASPGNLLEMLNRSPLPSPPGPVNQNLLDLGSRDPGQQLKHVSAGNSILYSLIPSQMDLFVV